MSKETSIFRWSPEGEDRVPGLENLEDTLDLSEAVARRGTTHNHRDRIESSAFVGIYDGNKFRVRYRKILDYRGETISRDLDVTSSDIGIRIAHLQFSPYLVSVDYYLGQRNIREVLEGLDPIDQANSQDTRLAIQPHTINPFIPFIGNVPGLKHPYNIFANNYDEARRLYVDWCEDTERFDAMHQVLADPSSLLGSFAVRHLSVFPLYLETARQNLARGRTGTPTEMRNITPFGA